MLWTHLAVAGYTTREREGGPGSWDDSRDGHLVGTSQKSQSEVFTEASAFWAVSGSWFNLNYAVFLSALDETQGDSWE